MATRFYLAGPMSGYPEWNFPAFKEAVSTCRDLGLVVICPAEMSGLPEQSHLKWEEHMNRDVRLVLEVDALIVLPGWHKSKGARMETFNALNLGKPIYSYHASLENIVTKDQVLKKEKESDLWAAWLEGQTEWLLKNFEDQGIVTAFRWEKSQCQS